MAREQIGDQGDDLDRAAGGRRRPQSSRLGAYLCARLLTARVASVWRSSRMSERMSLIGGRLPRGAASEAGAVQARTAGRGGVSIAAGAPLPANAATRTSGANQTV